MICNATKSEWSLNLIREALLCGINYLNVIVFLCMDASYGTRLSWRLNIYV